MVRKVCILIVDNSPVLGGAELYTIELSERARKEKYRFLFAITHKDRIGYLKQKNIEYIQFSSNKLKTSNIFSLLINLTSSVLQLSKIVSLNNVDIIQANTVRMHIICSIVSLITGKPLIWVHHAYDFNAIVFRILSYIPQKIVCVSITLKQYYEKHLGRKEKMKVIYNGVCIDENTLESNNYLNRKYSLQPNIKKVGVLGRIEKRKGQEYFVKSIPFILKENPYTVFFIIGGIGPGEEKYFDYVNQLIEGLKIKEKTIFTGFVENRFDMICSLDIVVQPSIEPETFGRVIIEAMSKLKPVVATNIGSFTEIITNNENGLLVKPKDAQNLAEAVIRILRDSTLSESLGKNGRETVLAKYSIINTVREFETVYDELYNQQIKNGSSPFHVGKLASNKARVSFKTA